jgi:tetratricopeptide (TPR) repeat protein
MIAPELRLAETSGIDASNPYPGLQAFGERDQAYFHGRAREREELFTLVRREVLTVLFGRSGLGKTSLLNAGLFPLLRQGDILPISIRLDLTPGKADLVTQVRAVCAAALRVQDVDARPPAEGETLWEYFHQTPWWSRRNQLLTPLLVFDPFEEIFTLGRRDERVEPLTAELADLIENHIPAPVRERVARTHEELSFSYERPKVRVVLSLREDFLPQLEGLRPRIPSLARNRYRLLHMDGHQALQAILKPGGSLVGEEAAREILRVVAGASRDDRAGVLGAPLAAADDLEEMEVEPALLSLFCRELNDRRKQRKLPEITVELVQAAHGEILSAFYDRCMTDIPGPVRIFVEERLLTGSGFRQSMPLEEALRAPGVTGESLAKLVDRRLLRIEERLGHRPHVELIHDVMTRVIRESRDRRRARVAHRRLLRRAALAAAGLLAVIAALVVFLARESRGRALAQQQRARAEQQRARAEQQRARADNYRAQAEDLVNYMLFNLRDQLLSKGNLDLLQTIARKALNYLEKVEKSDASELLKSAALETLGNVAMVEGKSDEAEKSYRKALAVERAFREKNPTNRRGQYVLAAGLTDLSHLLEVRGDYRGARESFSPALALWKDLALRASDRDEPPRSRLQATYAEASREFADLVSHHDMSAALSIYDAVCREIEELPAKKQARPELKATLALAYRGKGQILHQRGDSQAALAFVHKAMNIQKRLARESGENLQLQLDRSWSRELAAEVALSTGYPVKSLAMADSAASLVRPCLSRPVVGPLCGLAIAATDIVAGDALLAQGEVGAALVRYQAARAFLAEQVKRAPEELVFSQALSWANTRAGTAHARRGAMTLARQEWSAAVEIISPWVKSDSSDVLDVYVRPLLELGRLDEARPVCKKLQEREWNYLGLQQLCRSKGLLP